jgi:hypothetical protein
MRKNMSKKTIEPRGITIDQNCTLWGVSKITLKKLMKQGVVPGPLLIPGFGKLLFDREQQDRAIDALRQRT